ncbi:MAG: hypothetical protein M1828_000574 [Chrysothrix sp. TS-e1954]|nr:MAG: hypothetical protein M1828_000574 [Chrysothrix sp. TS-e1954]
MDTYMIRVHTQPYYGNETQHQAVGSSIQQYFTPLLPFQADGNNITIQHTAASLGTVHRVHSVTSAHANPELTACHPRLESTTFHQKTDYTTNPDLTNTSASNIDHTTTTDTENTRPSTSNQHATANPELTSSSDPDRPIPSPITCPSTFRIRSNSPQLEITISSDPTLRLWHQALTHHLVIRGNQAQVSPALGGQGGLYAVWQCCNQLAYEENWTCPSFDDLLGFMDPTSETYWDFILTQNHLAHSPQASRSSLEPGYHFTPEQLDIAALWMWKTGCPHGSRIRIVYLVQEQMNSAKHFYSAGLVGTHAEPTDRLVFIHQVAYPHLGTSKVNETCQYSPIVGFGFDEMPSEDILKQRHEASNAKSEAKGAATKLLKKSKKKANIGTKKMPKADNLLWLSGFSAYNPVTGLDLAILHPFELQFLSECFGDYDSSGLRHLKNDAQRHSTHTAASPKRVDKNRQTEARNASLLDHARSLLKTGNFCAASFSLTLQVAPPSVDTGLGSTSLPHDTMTAPVATKKQLKRARSDLGELSNVFDQQQSDPTERYMHDAKRVKKSAPHAMLTPVKQGKNVADKALDDLTGDARLNIPLDKYASQTHEEHSPGLKDGLDDRNNFFGEINDASVGADHPNSLQAPPSRKRAAPRDDDDDNDGQANDALSHIKYDKPTRQPRAAKRTKIAPSLKRAAPEDGNSDAYGHVNDDDSDREARPSKRAKVSKEQFRSRDENSEQLWLGAQHGQAMTEQSAYIYHANVDSLSDPDLPRGGRSPGTGPDDEAQTFGSSSHQSPSGSTLSGLPVEGGQDVQDSIYPNIVIDPFTNMGDAQRP